MKFDKKEKNKNELDLLFEEMVDTNKSNKIIPLKLQLRKSLESATLRNIMDLINGILTLLLSGFYLYSTYNPLNFKDGSMDWYNYISFLMHGYFLIEYTLKLYISQSFVNDLLSSNSFLDFMTTVPYIGVAISFGITTNDYNNPFITFTRMFDIWRLFTLSKFLNHINDEDNQTLISNVHVILSLVLCVTSLMKTIDDLTSDDSFYENVNKFHHEFFFIMTTVSIIGYSGPLPETAPRITVIFIILWSISVIPSNAGEIVNIISKRSKYADYKYKLITKVPHIVLIGNVSTKNAKNFFDEYFHPDHGSIIRHGVIVKPTRPDKKMEYMLESSKYISKVHYIEGNPHEKETFYRAKLDKATNVVIMGNNLTSDPSKEDANTILQTMVIKKYLKTHPNSNGMVRLQLLNPESIMHYELSLNKETK